MTAVASPCIDCLFRSTKYFHERFGNWGGASLDHNRNLRSPSHSLLQSAACSADDLAGIINFPTYYHVGLAWAVTSYFWAYD
jgi:hypothetical protein